MKKYFFAADKYFIASDWKPIPIKLRQKWSTETNHGKIEPTAELIAEIEAELRRAAADRPEYRFRFEIVDENRGERVWADVISIDERGIDQFGGCESVEHGVARMLRGFRQHVRAEYERENYA